jgi:transporter family-2 protein
MWIGIAIALLSGALMSIQGVFNTEVTKDTSMWVTNSWVQFSAFIICIVAWFFSDRKGFSAILHVEPKYMLFGGVIGAFITYTVIKSVDALGPAEAVMLILISQLTIAYLIEIFGVFGVEKVAFEWRRLLGVGICIGGIILFKWK